MNVLRIDDGIAAAIIRPDLGGGLERYDLIDQGREEPLFRPAPMGVARPFELANIVLIPWSGRISGGGFQFGDRFHPLAPNHPGEPLPLHGDGYAHAWTVSDAHASSVVLRFSSDNLPPFRYDATLTYRLDLGALTMELSLISRATMPLPHGIGFHPWLPREPGTTLMAPAKTLWVEDSQHLPAGDLPVAARKDWDFSTLRPLPGAWVCNAFTGWSGRACVTWPGRKLALEIAADPVLSTYILYSPASDADFFCFEPVSHPVDAHHLPGGPQAHGLVVLGPGETLRATCRFSPQRL